MNVSEQISFKPITSDQIGEELQINLYMLLLEILPTHQIKFSPGF